MKLNQEQIEAALSEASSLLSAKLPSVSGFVCIAVYETPEGIAINMESNVLRPLLPNILTTLAANALPAPDQEES
jgi:hypothetical protein